MEAEATGTPSVDASDPQELARELLSQVDRLLRDEPALDEQDRTEFTEAFSSSLKQVIASDTYAEPLTEAEFQHTINALKRRADEVGDDSSLARHLAGAIGALEQKQTKLVLEFNRRLNADGQESALAWLRAQQNAGGEADVAESGQLQSNDLPSTLRSEVTSSRSRRLRGPPRAK